MTGRPAPGAGRPVDVANLVPALRLGRHTVAAAVRALDRRHAELAAAGSGLDNARVLSVAFVSDADLARLHGRFLGDPSETDVITFPGEAVHDIAGEICISAEAARRHAASHRADPAEELTLYLAHGWLHLAGHDDRDSVSRRAMRRAEKAAMGYLRDERLVLRCVFEPRKVGSRKVPESRRAIPRK